MPHLRQSLATLMLLSVLSVGPVLWCQTKDRSLPMFGRDTVLVWKMQFADDAADFVVRIAEFLPDRFVEWENSTTQGTIFMSNKAILNGKSFVNARLFEGGVDTRGKDATTLWLSRQTFHDLKLKRRVKILLDSVDGWLILDGTDQMTVQVNRAPMTVPVIKVKDERGSERWFFDFEDNPLLAKHSVRNYSQTLVSVTTDKPNTLRWIKGKKLNKPH